MAAGATYEPIATTTLGSASNSVSFSSISGSYTDLILVAYITGVSVATDPWIRVGNGSVDTGTNYNWVWLSGNGGSASSESSINSSKLYYSSISTIQNQYQVVTFHFMNYSNTTTNKNVLIREADANTESGLTIGLWRSNSAINVIEISLDSSRTYSAGSMFTLYGVTAA